MLDSLYGAYVPCALCRHRNLLPHDRGRSRLLYLCRSSKGYNKAVSALWLVFAVIWELIGIPFLNAKQNSLIFIFIALGAFVCVIAVSSQ